MQLQFHTDDSSIQDAVHSFINQWSNDDDFLHVKTSGSTGTPKTIRILKLHARSSARMTGSYLGLYTGQNALLCLSPDTIAGKMMIVRALEWNLNLHVVSPSANPFKNITQPMHFVAMVPYQTQRVIEENPEVFHNKMQLIIGGGPIPAGLESKIRRLPCQSYHTFGMTETISHIALRNLSKKNSKFRLLNGVSAGIENGKLQISAPHLGVDNIVTNDCVTFHGPREFEWHGRLDFVINSGGVKIHPEEVEKRLAPLFDVNFFVIGIPDQQLGERLVLCVESSPMTIHKTQLEELLPKYHVPSKVFFYQKFIYTKSDKINRLATLADEERHEEPIL
ncbi:MAG: AMP-binding protein [bacterium]|nr:AMP-binding protein [bacterium]